MDDVTEANSVSTVSVEPNQKEQALGIVGLVVIITVVICCVVFALSALIFFFKFIYRQFKKKEQISNIRRETVNANPYVQRDRAPSVNSIYDVIPADQEPISLHLPTTTTHAQVNGRVPANGSADTSVTPRNDYLTLLSVNDVQVSIDSAYVRPLPSISNDIDIQDNKKEVTSQPASPGCLKNVPKLTNFETSLQRTAIGSEELAIDSAPKTYIKLRSDYLKAQFGALQENHTDAASQESQEIPESPYFTMPHVIDKNEKFELEGRSVDPLPCDSQRTKVNNGYLPMNKINPSIKDTKYMNLQHAYQHVAREIKTVNDTKMDTKNNVDKNRPLSLPPVDYYSDDDTSL